MTAVSVESLSAVVGLPLGVLAGVIATLGMDLVTPRLDEGFTPPRVAAGVLTNRGPDAAPERLAAVVHYVAGAGTGGLFVWLSLAVERLVAPSVGGTFLAAGVLLVGMYGFFAWLVLPRVSVSPARRSRIARAWAVSAVVYVLVLVPLVTVAGAVV